VTATSETSSDGVYTGPICYGATSTLPARCFPVEATLQQGKISGQWPGRDAGVTMHLLGEISAAGQVTIHMHGEKPDGGRQAEIDFTGTLRDGLLDAAGSFAGGRSATLNWRKSGPARVTAAPDTPTVTPADASPPAAPTTQANSPPTPAPAVVATNPVPPPAPTAAPVQAPPPRPASLSPDAAEGLHAGQVCFGPGPAEGPRCFRAQATLQQGRIIGQWPGRDPGVTIHLEGEVLPTGAVTIHMHADEANGRRRANANLTGTLHDGKLDATGAFLNGRSASLNWSKN
jgi:hypothetical protein